MSVREDAKLNLEMAGLFNKDSDYGGMIGEAVMKLVNTHLDEGHSGFSHSLALHIFNKVIKGEALTTKYYDMKKAELEKFAQENMGAPWKTEIMEEMIGKRPEPEAIKGDG